VLHRQVAEAVERLFAQRIEENVELLAYHWERAADMEKASHYLTRAGDRAAQLGASLEAVHLYELALQRRRSSPRRSKRRRCDSSMRHWGMFTWSTSRSSSRPCPLRVVCHTRAPGRMRRGRHGR